jgi:hypothetical protein
MIEVAGLDGLGRLAGSLVHLRGRDGWLACRGILSGGGGRVGAGIWIAGSRRRGGARSVRGVSAARLDVRIGRGFGCGCGLIGVVRELGRERAGGEDQQGREESSQT